MRSLLVLAPLVAGLIASPAGEARAATPASPCSLFAAPSGRDDASGSRTAPFGTVQRLVDALAPGQSGCLRAGVFAGGATISRPEITLTAAPGEEATLEGRVWVKQGADRVAVIGLRLDGVNARRLPSPTIDGNQDAFIDDDVTNEHTAICFNVGSDAGWGRAVGTTIRGSSVHGCGAPGTNLQHGIYVVAADDTLIAENAIYDNADRGIQLYPDAQRSTIRANVIDGNGEGILFSGAAGNASSDTVVEGNVIANSTLRTNVESWYPPGNPVGTGNVVRGNCIGSGAGGAQDVAQGGVVMAANVFADPEFADRAAGDFALALDSPCRLALETVRAAEAPEPAVGAAGPPAGALTAAAAIAEAQAWAGGPAPGVDLASPWPASRAVAASGSEGRREAQGGGPCRAAGPDEPAVIVPPSPQAPPRLPERRRALASPPGRAVGGCGRHRAGR